ncbi:MAG: DUF1576 domain-containing protein [Oscillospiraceae bacterium]
MTQCRDVPQPSPTMQVARRLCLCMALSMIGMGFFCNSPSEIMHGLWAYVQCPDVLVTDYFVVGSIGAAFVNGGLVVLISMGLLWIIKAPYNGSTIATLFLMGGFALFGKNPVNILPFFLGVWLYCKLKRLPMSRYANAALYSTMLAPIISDLMQKPPYPLPMRLVLAVLAGTLIGYVIIPLAEHSFSTHMGYTLFNYGFAGGLIALVIASLVKSMGYPIATQNIWMRGIDPRVLIYLLLLTGSLVLTGLWLCGWTHLPYLRIMRHSGRAPTDFLLTDGIGAAMVNMGSVGLLSLGYILFVGGDLNGPVVGAILTSAGFGAAGEHPKNTLPIMVGVFLASLVMVAPSTDPGLQLAALFGTALAPIAGQFGWPYGIVAGFLHSAVALAVGEPCGGYNLYNNGFSAGLVALVMVALIQGISKKWRAGDR